MADKLAAMRERIKAKEHVAKTAMKARIVDEIEKEKVEDAAEKIRRREEMVEFQKEEAERAAKKARLGDAPPGPIKCFCNELGQRGLCKKEGANLGRAFHACKKRQDEGRCKFFKWEEVPAASAAAAPAAVPAGPPEPEKCQCGDEAVRNVCRKEGPNMGRAFFACKKRQDEGRCKTFKWEEVPPAAAVPGAPAAQKCQCGDDAIRNVCRKEGPNMGRAFFACKKRQDEGRCRMFKWEEVPPADAANAQAGVVAPASALTGHGTLAVTTVLLTDNSTFNGTVAPSNSASASSMCYKCKQTGHFARDCPSTASSGAGAGAGAGGDKSSSICYKCKQPGHFSRDCTATVTAAAGAGGQTASSATCINCGQAPKCGCGDEAIRAVCKKEGPNVGRAFLACRKRQDEGRCKMFKWEDSSAECFKCAGA